LNIILSPGKPIPNSLQLAAKVSISTLATKKLDALSVIDILVNDIVNPTAANRVPDDLQHLLPLTPAVFFILFALAEGEKHGYAIMQTVSRVSDNQFRMGPGTLYTTIQRLLDLDLIEETENSGGQSDHEKRRRYYKLTRTGKVILTADISRMESVVRLARDKRLVPKTSG
jgi:DNA-binding PadR family transcriptional regulator